MTLKIEAICENGVFVPAQRPELAEHERVRLTVESASPDSKSSEVIRHRRRQRIHIDPALAKEIASAPEFDPNEG